MTGGLFDKNITFKDSEEWINRIDELIESKKLGVENRSELFRLLVRKIVRNPYFIFNGKEQKIPNLEELNKLLQEVKISIGVLSQQMASQDLMSKKEDVSNTDQLVSDFIDLLLDNARLKSCKTITEMEDLYPAEIWKKFTPKILQRLKSDGLVRITPSETLEWL